MKKYLIIVSFIFSLFFISDNVSALEFTASDSNTYQVVDAETFRDFIYYDRFKGMLSNSQIAIFIYRSSNYYCYKFNSTNTDSAFSPFFFESNNNYYFSRRTGEDSRTFYGRCYDLSSGTVQDDNGSYNFYYSGSIFYNYPDIYDNKNKSNIIKQSNFTWNDIETKYSSKIYHTITYYLNNEVYDEIEVEEGSSHTLLANYTDFNKYTHIFSGWQYDTENIDLTNITSDIEIKGTIEEKEKTPVYLDLDFPIDKNDFYTLLVLQSVLIMLIFLKWCFPFKGGRDLK